jgi:hypothetical protein
MQQPAAASSLQPVSRLPVILIAAVIQGWALYGLHRAIVQHAWPATQPAWLLALYAVAVFVPVSVELLAEHARGSALWRLLALLIVGWFGFGWHHGAWVADLPGERFASSGDCFPLAFELSVLWLLVLPFLQTRLASGRWQVDYRALFTYAWRNKITLAEAALFTGLFWLILFLWQSLFHMLKIDFFQQLFREPLFIYPATSIAFGCALHLIGSIDRLVAAVLEQILNVLKWLALVAGALLALFTLALLPRLPGLVFTGQKAIGAAWLLWLIAVIVLLLNAAYRDGTVERPYPRWIALALRLIVPLTVIVSLTALYALGVRTAHYGLTVERVWALIVAAAALVYSCGYALAALGRGAWLAGIARVNVIVAVALIVTIGAALTPLLSPYRLAANSQYALALTVPVAADSAEPLGQTAFHYLRFDAGRYGRERLKVLAQRSDGPNAPRTRELAAAALAQQNAWAAEPGRLDVEQLVKAMPVYPAGRSNDAQLITALVAELSKPENGSVYQTAASRSLAGLYIDLRGDGQDEFVLLTGGAGGGLLFEQHAGEWRLAGHVRPRASNAPWQGVLADLDKGNIAARPAPWKELWVGSRQFRVEGTQQADAAQVGMVRGDSR